MSLNYKIFDLSEDEYQYLFSKLDEYRRYKIHQEKVEEWHEHIMYKARSCQAEVGTEDAKKIFRDAYNYLRTVKKDG